MKLRSTPVAKQIGKSVYKCVDIVGGNPDLAPLVPRPLNNDEVAVRIDFGKDRWAMR
jgi:hypothetical protein